MQELTVSQQGAPPDAPDIALLAREMAAAYQTRVLRYKHTLGLSTQEAAAKAEKPCPVPRVWEIQGRPPEDVTWEDLDELQSRDPELALRRCKEVQEAAREAVRSGALAAAYADTDPSHSRAWPQAEFLAIRAELADGWQPRNGIERQLLDQMAMAQAAMFFFQRCLFGRATAGIDEEAGAMVERFQKVFVRAQRALFDLRKAPPAVFVQNAGQVNVAAQQLNMHNGDARPRQRERRPPRAPEACTCLADRRRIRGR
jgi:hypothetical protein